MNKIVVTGLVAIHLAASLWHNHAHAQLAVTLSPGQAIFAFGVILIAPIVAAALVWTHYKRLGLWAFFLSMLGAFLFGVYHHYVSVSPDNIGHLPAGSPESHSLFISSAAAIALIELGSALYGAYCIRSDRAQSRARA